MRVRVVLVDGQDAAIGAFRFGILLQAIEGRAEIAERVCVVRLKRDRPFKGHNGIFDLVKMKESDAMNAMSVRIIGIPSSCVAVHDFSFSMWPCYYDIARFGSAGIVSTEPVTCLI